MWRLNKDRTQMQIFQNSVGFGCKLANTFPNNLYFMHDMQTNKTKQKSQINFLKEIAETHVVTPVLLFTLV